MYVHGSIGTRALPVAFCRFSCRCPTVWNSEGRCTLPEHHDPNPTSARVFLGRFVAQAYVYQLTVGSRKPTHSRAAGSLNLLRFDLSLSTLLVSGSRIPLVLLHLETFRDTEPIPFMTATPDNADESVHASKVHLRHTTRKYWALFSRNLRVRVKLRLVLCSVLAPFGPATINLEPH